ncbi:TlpA disulfide reductase family protein [Flavobacterium sp. Fl-77]|uniref:TlpA disulfide reductase family protein n=1 Tax=Flavobacterium flavipigmentatum TaxID=2893884 RepID=A0AAJ2W065_9FLAO|nr:MULTISPECIES: TlpA disulfide reductase family protein [unclassified Flavobacterium]MDX6181164.1 TlpA disulfide reductase family protein [Flavobacterium sp. Fl-33]MDX6184765.1 TlpA disulfide reductase family protein [Flavobacterium sp. Fl-77]UFH39863.1 TlpA family protein disulfide reductase [Flavobacterium sp. F-70]
MKKLFVAGLLIFSTLNVVGQAKNQVKFTAKIANRNSDTLVIRGANGFKQIVPISKDEIFAANFEAPKGFYNFTDGTESTSLFLLPDSEVNLTMNAKEFDESIVYKGKGVNESNFLAQYALNNEKFQAEAFLKEPAEFTALLEQKKKADTEAINKGDFDAEFKKVLLDSFEQFNQYAFQQYSSTSKMRKLNGNPSPEFNFDNYKGGKTKLADLKGKYVYIDLWATWCAPCRAEIPFLQKIEEKYHGKNIEFVSISIDKAKDNEKWKKFVADKKLGGIQLFADKDWESDFVVKYGVTGIPRFILIDPKGNIVNADAERPSSPELQTQLDALLK